MHAVFYSQHKSRSTEIEIRSKNDITTEMKISNIRKHGRYSLSNTHQTHKLRINKTKVYTGKEIRGKSITKGTEIAA